jgi:urease accessory protein
MRILAFAIAVTMVPTAAIAHPGHPSGLEFTDGFLHSFTGADHLVAPLLVGALAVLSRRTPSVLGALMAAVAAGLLVGGSLAHEVAPAAELGIVLGFAALAAAFLLPQRSAWLLPLAAAATGVAHGLVHGSQGGGGTAFAAGVLGATATLAGAGYLVACWSTGWRRRTGSARG